MTFELDLTCMITKSYTKLNLEMQKHVACRKEVRKTAYLQKK